MFGTFQGAEKFNQPLGKWNVSNVTSMIFMFSGAHVFNHDLSGWCVQKISSEPQAFSTESVLPDAFKPIWGTCPD